MTHPGHPPPNPCSGLSAPWRGFGRLVLAMSGSAFLALGFALTGSRLASATFQTKDLKITGISSKGFSYSPGRADADGLAPFQVRGDPNLVATLPSQNLTITCAKLNGRIHVKSGALASADLTVGLTAVSKTVPSTNNPSAAQTIRLESASTHYKNLTWKEGSASLPASEFDFPHPLLISGSSSAPETTYSIHGSSGQVDLKTVAPSEGETLESASVKGSVALEFERSGGSKSQSASPTRLNATADEASIRRVAETSNKSFHYVIRLTGNVNVSSTAPSGTTTLQDLSGIEITLNRQFEVIGWQGLDDGASGTFQPSSAQYRHRYALGFQHTAGGWGAH